MSRLLVIDDDQEVLALIKERLPHLGTFQIFTAQDAYQALETMNLYKFDLVLIDIELPFVNGYQLAATIQARPSTRNIPFLFISSRNQKKDVDRAIDKGACDYLIKPFSMEQLAKRIDRLLKFQPRAPNQSIKLNERAMAGAMLFIQMDIDIISVSDSNIEVRSPKDLSTLESPFDLRWIFFEKLGFPTVKVLVEQPTLKGEEFIFSLGFYKPSFEFVNRIRIEMRKHPHTKQNLLKKSEYATVST